MHYARVVLLAAGLLIGTAALASERGLMIRAGDLFEQPFIDAKKLGPLTPNQPVTIVERRGGWISVDAGGKRGWVRLLNLRLEPAVQPTAGRSTAALRTGSTGRTVATGVKGLDEADIRSASLDRGQLAQLELLGVTDDAAKQYGSRNQLKESLIAYLKPGKAP